MQAKNSLYLSPSLSLRWAHTISCNNHQRNVKQNECWKSVADASGVSTRSSSPFQHETIRVGAPNLHFCGLENMRRKCIHFWGKHISKMGAVMDVICSKKFSNNKMCAKKWNLNWLFSFEKPFSGPAKYWKYFVLQKREGGLLMKSILDIGLLNSSINMVNTH